MKVKEIKEASNTILIARLCTLMYSETKKAMETQQRICVELENRNVITSSKELGKLIDIFL